MCAARGGGRLSRDVKREHQPYFPQREVVVFHSSVCRSVGLSMVSIITRV